MGLVRDGRAVIGGDGQVTFGDTVVKHTARKVRTLYNDQILAGFAGSAADAITLFERMEEKLEEYNGNLARAAVELARDWRSDRILRRLDAMLIVLDRKRGFILSGAGDIIEPEDGILAIGSGAPYAQAAAKALLKHTQLPLREVCREALLLASEICIYTNDNLVILELE